MIEFLEVVGSLALLFVVLFAAFGRDERDNMRGYCKAAAIRAANERRYDP